jgi:hypothetical protein
MKACAARTMRRRDGTILLGSLVTYISDDPVAVPARLGRRSVPRTQGFHYGEFGHLKIILGARCGR